MKRVIVVACLFVWAMVACSEREADTTSSPPTGDDAGAELDPPSDAGADAGAQTEFVDLTVGGSKQSWSCPATAKLWETDNGEYVQINFGPCGTPEALTVFIAPTMGEQRCGKNQFEKAYITWTEDNAQTFYKSYGTVDGGTSGYCEMVVKDIGTTTGFVELEITQGMLSNSEVSVDDSARNIKGSFRVRLR